MNTILRQCKFIDLKRDHIDATITLHLLDDGMFQVESHIHPHVASQESKTAHYHYSSLEDAEIKFMQRVNCYVGHCDLLEDVTNTQRIEELIAQKEANQPMSVPLTVIRFDAAYNAILGYEERGHLTAVATTNPNSIQLELFDVVEVFLGELLPCGLRAASMKCTRPDLDTTHCSKPIN